MVTRFFVVEEVRLVLVYNASYCILIPRVSCNVIYVWTSPSLSVTVPQCALFEVKSSYNIYQGTSQINQGTGPGVDMPLMEI